MTRNKTDEVFLFSFRHDTTIDITLTFRPKDVVNPRKEDEVVYKVPW